MSAAKGIGRKKEKAKFSYLGASDVQKSYELRDRCIEKYGRSMTAREDKSVPCDMKVCLVRTNRKVLKGEQFYTAADPSRIQHKMCADNSIARHEAMGKDKNWKEQERNRVIPPTTEELEVPAAVYDEPASEDVIAAAEAAYSPPLPAPAAHSIKDIQLLLELAELRGFKAATMAFLRSKERS